MNFQMRMLFYYVPLASGIGMACSGPIIKIYMCSQVSPEIVSLANILGVALSILINGAIHSERTMEMFRKKIHVAGNHAYSLLYNHLSDGRKLARIAIYRICNNGGNYWEFIYVGF